MNTVNFEALILHTADASIRLEHQQTAMNFLAAIQTVEGLEQFFAGYVHETKKYLMRSHIAAGAVRMHNEGLTTDVHTEHCCIVHGCKYRDDACSVMTKAKAQSYPCETCQEY